MQLALFNVKPGTSVKGSRRSGTVKVATATWLYFTCDRARCSCHGLVTDRHQSYHRVAVPR